MSERSIDCRKDECGASSSCVAALRQGSMCVYVWQCRDKMKACTIRGSGGGGCEQIKLQAEDGCMSGLASQGSESRH